MNVVKHKHDGEIVYSVFIGQQRVARVCKGWLALGGEQWVAQMANRPAFGEKTLKNVMRRIEKLAGGAA